MGKLRAAALTTIRAYRRLVSPGFPPVCRFFPSCSSYAWKR
jgi:putative component of membrane protein insertase Oxa1/YidC/SpoIIIJ protein YidD